jgi:hypothetical protein
MSPILKIALLGVVAFHTSAYSKVSLEKFGTTEKFTIKIEGLITKPDASDFQSILQKIKHENLKLHLDTVQLNSDGGKPFTATQIGELIRKNRLTTYIAPDSKCYSSCTFIFIAGVQRYAFGELGVHQMAVIEGKEFTYKEIEDAYVKFNKEFKGYFDKMRISENFQRLNYDTSFWDIRVLTEKEKFDWHINGTDIVETAVLMSEYAKRKNIDRGELEIIFADNYRACFDKMKNLEMTVWDCAAEKELLDQWDRIYYGTIVRFKHYWTALFQIFEELRTKFIL